MIYELINGCPFFLSGKINITFHGSIEAGFNTLQVQSTELSDVGQLLVHFVAVTIKMEVRNVQMNHFQLRVKNYMAGLKASLEQLRTYVAAYLK